MILRQTLFTNMFLRNMLADFGNRSADCKIPGNFTLYFQYRIGNYQPEFYLYFPKEPFQTRYKNEVFNKLQEYTGYGMINYLDFHYSNFPVKRDFLRFLQYESSSRLKQKPGISFRQKLQIALEWVAEKQQDLRGSLQKDNKEEIDFSAAAMAKKLSDHIEQIMTNTEIRMENLTGSFISGDIELNNHNHLEKLIQLLILLQTVQAPKQISKTEQLFKKFSATDIASILHLHFGAFKDKRINTLQVKIREAGERLNHNNPRVERITIALQEFFY
jgi:hypothetical protein